MLKKYLFLSSLFIITILVGCKGNTGDNLPEIYADDLITMENLDDYMFRDDVQYVDLRNYEAVFHSGFIYSFEIIPFFDYLDYRAFDRNDTYEFEPDQLLDPDFLESIFDRDKSIFFYADGCIRGGYLKDILNYLGYEKVFVIGGFYEYKGEYKVLGDGSFTLGDTFYNYHYDDENKLHFYTYGTFDMGRKIISIRFDVLDEFNVSLRSPEYDIDNPYDAQFSLLEDHIYSDGVTMNELYFSLTNLLQSGYNEVTDFNVLVFNGIVELIYELKAN